MIQMFKYLKLKEKCEQIKLRRKEGESPQLLNFQKLLQKLLTFESNILSALTTVEETQRSRVIVPA